jgi:hypothetical protein
LVTKRCPPRNGFARLLLEHEQVVLFFGKKMKSNNSLTKTRNLASFLICLTLLLLLSADSRSRHQDPQQPAVRDGYSDIVVQREWSVLPADMLLSVSRKIEYRFKYVQLLWKSSSISF